MKKSFSHEIKEYVKDFLLGRSYQVEVLDLYEIGFNPVLSLKELSMLDKDELPKGLLPKKDVLKYNPMRTPRHIYEKMGSERLMKKLLIRES